MKVTLKTSGGFANIQLHGEIDTSELEPELAERAESLLTSANLSTAHHAEVDPHFADAQLYEVTVHDEGDEPRRYVVSDASADPALSDTLSALMREVVKKRAGGGGD